jgi:hypothetical protein
MAVLFKGLERLRGVRDFIRIDDPVVVAIQRLDDWRQRRPAAAAHSTGSALSALSTHSASLSPWTAWTALALAECAGRAAQCGAERQRDNLSSFTPVDLFFHFCFGVMAIAFACVEGNDCIVLLSNYRRAA